MVRIFCALILLSLQQSIITGQLYEGSVCTANDGNQGTCIKPEECPSFIEDLRNKRVPITCFFEGHLPFVCCSNARNGSSSERVARESMIGRRIDRKLAYLAVHGGTDVAPREFPHLAAIGFVRRFKQFWNCGGTLISKRYVMTAAHCLEDRKYRRYGKAVNVRLGDLDLKDTSDDANAQVIDVQRRIPHPEYKFPMKYNDLGLLELKEDAVFNDFVKPACLHKTYDINGKSAIISGWGSTEKGPTPGHQKLLKVELNIQPLDKCTTVMNKIGEMQRNMELSEGLKDDSMICAGVTAGGMDSCDGDSGSPLQVKSSSSECSGEIIGITSFAFDRECGKPDTPAIYVRVSKYVPWIESIINSSG